MGDNDEARGTMAPFLPPRLRKFYTYLSQGLIVDELLGRYCGDKNKLLLPRNIHGNFGWHETKRLGLWDSNFHGQLMYACNVLGYQMESVNVLGSVKKIKRRYLFLLQPRKEQGDNIS